MIKLATAGIVLALALSAVAAAQQTHASAALSHPSPRLDRALAQRLAAAGRDSTVDVVVVLDEQAALPSSARKNRHARVRDVVNSLHATAAATQKPLLALLRARQAAGRVASFEPLWVFNGFVVSAKPEVVRELAHRRDVREVRLSASLSAPASPLAAAAVESNLSAVNAPALWSLGYQGQGVVVANLDTGVDVRHPDLNAAWRGGADSWYDPNGEHPTTPTDVSGHGTWTMGVMVGGDRGGTAIGVAPAAKWIAAKIFNDRGIATTAKIHQAFQWLLDPDHDPSTADTPDVVNGSWTFGAPGCNLEFQLDLQSLRAAGILPVFAAGNSGPLAGSSYSPANNPGAISVGGTDNAGGIASWSSRGPSACDGGVYPDVTAPGVNVTTSDLYGLYAAKSGTSMAAPHVSGALALLLGRFPDLPADRQESALEQSALDAGTAGPDNSFGYGRLDVLAAYNWLATTPDFTLAAAPASSTTAAGGQVSYTVTVTPLNGFAGDVSLSLAGLTSAQGSGSFTPALIPGGGGDARLDVTTSTSLGPGSYPPTVAATSGSTTHTVTVTLVVPAPPDFSLAISPASASAAAGTSAAYAVTVGSLNGFAGDVALSLTGLSASQASWSFTPASVSGSGTSQLGITTAGSLAPGSYPLTVTGTSGSSSHSAAATLVVPAPPDFTLSASPFSVNTAPGGNAAFTVTVGALNGFTGNVGLSLSGLSVSQASWTFTPAGVSGSGSSQLLITTATTLAAGSYPLTITGSSGSGSTVHSASVTLSVGTTPDFSLAAAPASETVLRGGAANYSLTVLRSGGFSGSVALSVSGLPFGSQASLSPNPVSGGASTLRVTTAFWTVRGTFTLSITGRSGALTRKATVKLVVS